MKDFDDKQKAELRSLLDLEIQELELEINNLTEIEAGETKDILELKSRLDILASMRYWT